MEPCPVTIAVVGLGALGLVTLKNLSEEGFDVTGFERNGYVGGLWQYVLEEKTSVLPTTIINVSKERGCFTDFPFPEETPSICPASEVQKYLESYASHFDLLPKIRFETVVTGVFRDEAAGKWAVEIEGSGRQMFDKVVLATGINAQPHIPHLEGLENFSGNIVHSQGFKKPEEFKGRAVLVVGLGNTGADTAVSLVGHASRIFVSHRDGAYILPRTRNGRSIDHTLTARFLSTQGLMERFLPRTTERLLNAFVKMIQGQAFNIRPEWGLSPAPSLKHSVPIVSDEIVDALESGAVESVKGLRRVVGPRTIELEDGSRLEVDSIILCTGYKADYSLLDSRFDPTRNTRPDWAAASGSRGKPLPRLYQNIISLDFPDSLAFMGSVAFATPAFQLYDMASMALTQIWKGTSPMPPKVEMEAAVDACHAWICDLARQGNVFPGLVKQHEWMAWANRTAGTGVDEYLGWGWKGLKFWITQPRFYNLLVSGVYSPHLYRLFPGRRKV